MTKQFNYSDNRPIDVICMGRVAVDLYAEQIGVELAEVQSFKKYLGGCAGNITVGTARLGLKSSMFSCVGSDAMGTFLKSVLTRENVRTDLLSTTDQHLTGLVLLGVDPPDHFPLIFYRENCADMQLQTEQVDIEIFKQSKSLLITGTGLSTTHMSTVTHHAVDTAKKVDTKVIIDLDYRPVLWGITSRGDGETRYQASDKVSAEYEKILTKVDLIVGTEEEIFIAGGSDDLTNALQQIRELTPAPVIMKQGVAGCAIYLEDLYHPIQVKPFPVEVLNVLGAGDAFMSGFLYGLLTGCSWQQCGQFGNAAGAIVVTRHGCAPAMPGIMELNYFVKNYHQQPDILQSENIQKMHSEFEFI